MQTNEDELLTDAGGPGEPGGADMGKVLLEAVARHPWMIASFTVLGAIGGIFSAVIRPNVYTSTGKVLVRTGLRESLTPETGLQADLGPQFAPGVLEERELFQDPLLYEQVAREVGPLDLIQPSDPGSEHAREDQSLMARFHRFQSWWFARSSPLRNPQYDPDSPGLLAAAVATVQDSTAVSNPTSTQVLRLDVSLGSPELAQRTLQALMRAYDERHRSIYRPERQLKFIDEQLTAARKQAADIEDHRRAHEAQCGLVDVTVEVAALGQRLRDLEPQDDNDRVRLRAIAREAEYIDGAIKSMPATIDVEIPPQRIQNPRLAELMTEQSLRNGELVSLGQSFTEGSETYRNQETMLRRRLQAIEEEMAHTEPTLLAGSTIVQRTPNPRYEQLIGRRDLLEQEKVRLAVGLEARGPTVLALQDRREKALACATQHTEFARESAEADRRVGVLVAARERTALLGVINDEERMSNLVVLQEASLPTEKSGPERAKPSLIGLALGGALGVGLALLLQLLNSKIRTARDIESGLKLHVIGVVPEQRAWRKAGSKILKPASARG